MNLLDLLFPKRCVSCGQVGSYLCSECLKKVKFCQFQICPVCRKPSITGAVHSKCRTRYSLDGLTSISQFEGPVRSAIKKIKYKWVADLADELVGIVLENLWKEKWLPDDKFTIVSVPLSPRREKWRGFNQSSLLGKILAQKLELEFNEQILVKIKDTKPQVELKARQRKENLNGAFRVFDKMQVLGESFLLIDDMTTTGSTLRNCASTLKRAGARKIWALTLARSG